jgi:hypothetical protein
VLFLDNAIVNGTGADLVVFELSGRLDPGVPEPRERFGISVFDGTDFRCRAGHLHAARSLAHLRRRTRLQIGRHRSSGRLELGRCPRTEHAVNSHPGTRGAIPPCQASEARIAGRCAR